METKNEVNGGSQEFLYDGMLTPESDSSGPSKSPRLGGSSDLSRSFDSAKLFGTPRTGGRLSSSQTFNTDALPLHIPYSESKLGDRRLQRGPHQDSRGLPAPLQVKFESTKERVNAELLLFAEEISSRLCLPFPLPPTLFATSPSSTSPSSISRGISPRTPPGGHNYGHISSMRRHLTPPPDWGEPPAEREARRRELPSSSSYSFSSLDVAGLVERAKELQCIALRCVEMAPNEFAYVAEDLVRDLNLTRTRLAPGWIKQLHTRLLFILTRCTRLLQLHKEAGGGPLHHHHHHNNHNPSSFSMRPKEESWAQPSSAPLQRFFLQKQGWGGEGSSASSPGLDRTWAPPPSPARDYEFRLKERGSEGGGRGGGNGGKEGKGGGGSGGGRGGGVGGGEEVLPHPAPWRLRDPQAGSGPPPNPYPNPHTSTYPVPADWRLRDPQAAFSEPSGTFRHPAEFGAGAGQAALLANKLAMWKKSSNGSATSSNSSASSSSSSSSAAASPPSSATAAVLATGCGVSSLSPSSSLVPPPLPPSPPSSSPSLPPLRKSTVAGSRLGERRMASVDSSSSSTPRKAEKEEEEVNEELAVAAAVDNWDRDEMEEEDRRKANGEEAEEEEEEEVGVALKRLNLKEMVVSRDRGAGNRRMEEEGREKGGAVGLKEEDEAAPPCLAALKLGAKRFPYRYGEWGAEAEEEDLGRLGSDGTPTGTPPGTNEEEYFVLCRICEEEISVDELEEHSQLCALADENDNPELPHDQRLACLASALASLVKDISSLAENPHHYPPPHSQHWPDRSPRDNSTFLDSSSSSLPPAPAPPGIGSSSSSSSVTSSPNTLFSHSSLSLTSSDSRTSSGNASPHAGPPPGAATVCGVHHDHLQQQQPQQHSSSGGPKEGEGEGDAEADVEAASADQKDRIEELQELEEVANIARDASAVLLTEDDAEDFLADCLRDLDELMHENNVQRLPTPLGVRVRHVSTDVFGKRVRALIEDKFLSLRGDVGPTVEGPTTTSEGDYGGEDELFSLRSGRSTPLHTSANGGGANRQVSIADFEIIKPISRGAYGRVLLARKKATGDLFAIKVLRKSDMVRKNAVESVTAERNILVRLQSPFVVRFFYSFTCQHNLYLVMEYLNGGDMFSLVRSLGCLDESVARLYIAELVLALEYLHSLGVVHRDIKPDNLLIAHDGHIKLTDFGLSKIGLVNSTGDFSGVQGHHNHHNQPTLTPVSEPYSPKTNPFATSLSQATNSGHSSPSQKLSSNFPPSHSPQGSLRSGNASPQWAWQNPEGEFIGPGESGGDGREASGKVSHRAVGTPDYLAPEILLGTEHGATADWWSVGVILFEFLTGVPPFNAPTPELIFENILNHQIPWPSIPDEMSYEAQDLIFRLLAPDPRERLGYRGAGEVKAHPFFQNVRWDSLAWEKAAFIPTPDHPTDTSYFTTRGAWNPEDDSDSCSETSDSTSTTQFANREVSGTDEAHDLAHFENTVKNAFTNFSFKNLSQLASINYDILGRSGRDSPSSHYVNSPSRDFHPSPARCRSLYNSPARDFQPSPIRQHSYHASPGRDFG